MTDKRRRVGVTQRVHEIQAYSERRDSLDQRWVSFLDACGADIVPLPNRHPDLRRYTRSLGIDALVLTGGEDVGRMGDVEVMSGAADVTIAPERDAAEFLLVKVSIEFFWPVIGVCRGMQFLNAFHGGRLRRVDGHVARRHRLQSARGVQNRAFEFDRDVNSYHRFGIGEQDLAPGLIALAAAEDSIEAFAHPTLPQYGVMWHPERNAVFSDNDIAFFCSVFADGRCA